MSLSISVPNYYKWADGKGMIDLSSDTIQLALMKQGFGFDVDNHEVWSDVSVSEIDAGYGYSSGGITLSLDVYQQNNTYNRAEAIFDEVILEVAGGNIGPVAGLLLYNTTVSDIIVAYGQFSTPVIIYSGFRFVIKSIALRRL